MGSAPRVGDVVAWLDVPAGAMVRSEDVVGPRTFVSYYIRTTATHGCTAATEGFWSAPSKLLWPWLTQQDRIGANVTIVALRLTGQETATDLQKMAEQLDRAQAPEVSHG